MSSSRTCALRRKLVDVYSISVSLVILAVIFLIACERTPTSQPTPVPPATPLPPAAPAPNPVPPPVPPSTPSPPAIVHSASRVDAPTSLDELIFLSDVIARVSLLSAQPGTELINYTDSSGSLPVFSFRFEVMEYLKGSGGSELTVKVPVRKWNVSDGESAQRLAESAFAARDVSWDNREALIFLESESVLYGLPPVAGASGQASYQFTGPHEDPVDINEYAITSSYSKAWLPSIASGGAKGTSGTDDRRYITEATLQQAKGAAGASSASPPAISLSEIKRRIKANDDLLAAGRDISGYVECVQSKHRYEALIQDGQAPAQNPLTEVRIQSGQPRGHRLSSLDNVAVYPESPTNGKWWTSGPHSDLFITRVTDDHDNDPNTKGYAWEDVITRPIPKGIYTVFLKVQPAIWMPCDYNPELEYDHPHREMSITVTAPSGTVHEAFFDPVAIGTAVGADDTNGVLKPASFTFKGVGDVSIERIEWESGSVEMELAPHSRLADHHIDFIALDGTVSLRLDFDDATEVDEDGTRALSWGVCKQPWSEGDLLMLRIGSGIPADGIAATNEPECQSSLPDQISVPTAVPTPEPTPERTATSEPTAEPTPKPEPTVTPEPAVTRETEPAVTATTTPERASERTATSEPTATPSP